MTLSKGAAAAKRKRSISPPHGRPRRIRKPTERAAAAAAEATATSSRGRKATVRTEEEEDALHAGMEVIEVPSDSPSEPNNPSDSSDVEEVTAAAAHNHDDAEAEPDTIEEDAESEMCGYFYIGNKEDLLTY